MGEITRVRMGGKTTWVENIGETTRGRNVLGVKRLVTYTATRDSLCVYSFNQQCDNAGLIGLVL